MKKRVYATLLILMAFIVIGCTTKSSTSSWTHQQRKEMRRALHQYRDMVYIDEMSDVEFVVFANNVTDEIEAIYPSYALFASLPAVSDSVDMYVTTTIIEELDADGSNMRHIYPYRDLKRSDILPKGLSRKEQRSFYKCLARKINAKYSNFEQFFRAVVSNSTNSSEITTMEQACAKSLFNYTPKSKNNSHSN